jgi:hypothetical protein
VSWHRSKLRENLVEQPTDTTGRSDHALHCHAERVDRVRSSLATPLFVPRDGAQICGLYDDSVERACVARRIRVLVGGYLETASARVPCTEARRRPEGKLAHRGSVAGGGFSTCCGVPEVNMYALVQRDSRFLPGELHPE